MARLGVPWWDLTHVFVSHFHNDHIGDLPALLHAFKYALPRRRRRPLVLGGPAGLPGLLGRLAEAHGDHVREPGVPVEVVEFTGEAPWHPVGGDFVVKTRDTVHADPSIAYRVETAGGSLGYTGDTGPSPSLGSFFDSVDLLISECGASPDRPLPNHLRPCDVGAIAEVARPGLVVTTHVYPPADPTGVPDLVAGAGYEGAVIAGTDGQVFRLPIGGLGPDPKSGRSGHPPTESDSE
jgi:ribonuclease BN (tRNA processing enzyme)